MQRDCKTKRAVCNMQYEKDIKRSRHEGEGEDEDEYDYDMTQLTNAMCGISCIDDFQVFFQVLGDILDSNLIAAGTLVHETQSNLSKFIKQQQEWASKHDTGTEGHKNLRKALAYAIAYSMDF